MPKRASCDSVLRQDRVKGDQRDGLLPLTGLIGFVAVTTTSLATNLHVHNNVRNE